MKFVPLDGRQSHARFVGLLVSAVTAARLLFLAALPDDRIVQHVPDDAFYYLQAARNFARLGRWTFDGVEPSSGFHLLWAYLLALFFKADPSASLHTLFLTGGVVQGSCLVAAAFLITRSAERFAGPSAWGGVLLVLLSAISLLQTTWMMESSFVIATAAAVLYLLARPQIQLTPARLLLGFALGALALLSRSDAGLLVVFFLLAHGYRRVFRSGATSMVWMSAAVFSGALLGLEGVTLHTHWISGQWIQASAQEKVLWTQRGVPSFGVPAHFTWDLFDPLYNVAAPFTAQLRSLDLHLHPIHHIYPLSAMVVALVCGLAAWGFVRQLRSTAMASAVLLLVPVATIVAYVVAYRSVSGAMEGWYVANFEVPVAIFAAVGLAPFFHARPTAMRLLLAAVCIPALLCSLVAPFPWQEEMWRAGIYLREHPSAQPAGAWNTGILGYFADSGVVNLDGLMNDSLLPYTRRGDLVAYIAKRGIGSIVDSPEMWKPENGRKGGYADGTLENCILRNDDLFPNDLNNIFGNDHIRLYTLDPVCLRRSAP